MANSDPFYEHRLHNLEINLTADDTYSWPLFCRKSRIFSGKTVFHLEGYRALSELYKKLGEWFSINPDSSEQNFLQQEERLNVRMEGQVPYYAHLLIPVYKRTICRIDVKVYNQIVRLAGLEDYLALREILSLMFDSSKGAGFFGNFKLDGMDNSYVAQEQKKMMNVRFKELLEMWRKDEEYYEAQENAGVYWFGTGGYIRGASMIGGMGGIGGSGIGLSDIDGGMGGHGFNPAMNEEQLRIFRIENMCGEDYRRMREEIFAVNIALLRRNQELLDMNRDILDKCNRSDDEEKFKAILKDNQRFKMEVDLLQKQVSGFREEGGEINILIAK